MAKPDLVKRLSDEPTSHELKRGLDAETTRIWHGLCLEACDEIERLREENTALTDGPLPPTEREVLLGKINFMEEEIEWLRKVKAELAALRASFADAMHALEVVAALRSGSKRELQDFARQERKNIVELAGCESWFDAGEKRTDEPSEGSDGPEREKRGH